MFLMKVKLQMVRYELYMDFTIQNFLELSQPYYYAITIIIKKK